ncbi:MAG TPA: phosphopantetheine-binding protein [Pyrinomonadaceae bacterium]|jgi:acyl carrier protein
MSAARSAGALAETLFVSGSFMSERVFQRVAELIAKGTKIPVERIRPDSTFEELGMDSLDGTTLLYELEEAFDLSIPDEVALKFKDVPQVVAYLEGLGVAI